MTAPALLCPVCGAALNGQPVVTVESVLHETGRPDVPIATLGIHANCYAREALAALAFRRER